MKLWYRMKCNLWIGKLLVLSSKSEKLSGSCALVRIPETSLCGETTESHSNFLIFVLNSHQHTVKIYQLSKVSTVSWLLFAWSFFHHFSCYPLRQSSKIFQASFSHFLIFLVVSSLLMSWSGWILQHFIDGFKVWHWFRL